MEKLAKKYFSNLSNHFNQFTHHRGLIFSVINGQYDGTIYIDNLKKPKVIALFTPFNFSFITGIDSIDDSSIALSMIKQHDMEHHMEEAIFFTDHEKSHLYLSEKLKVHNVIQTKRYTYEFNRDKFTSIFNHHHFNHIVQLRESKDELSNCPYWMSFINEGDEQISFCKAFASGNGFAEIDVYSHENHRHKGYAFECSLILLNKLIDIQIEPEWNTWPYREASQKLAERLGFEFNASVEAIVWVKEECLPFN